MLLIMLLFNVTLFRYFTVTKITSNSICWLVFDASLCTKDILNPREVSWDVNSLRNIVQPAAESQFPRDEED